MQNAFRKLQIAHSHFFRKSNHLTEEESTLETEEEEMEEEEEEEAPHVGRRKEETEDSDEDATIEEQRRRLSPSLSFAPLSLDIRAPPARTADPDGNLERFDVHISCNPGDADEFEPFRQWAYELRDGTGLSHDRRVAQIQQRTGCRFLVDNHRDSADILRCLNHRPLVVLQGQPHRKLTVLADSTRQIVQALNLLEDTFPRLMARARIPAPVKWDGTRRWPRVGEMAICSAPKTKARRPPGGLDRDRVDARCPWRQRGREESKPPSPRCRGNFLVSVFTEMFAERLETKEKHGQALDAEMSKLTEQERLLDRRWRREEEEAKEAARDASLTSISAGDDDTEKTGVLTDVWADERPRIDGLTDSSPCTEAENSDLSLADTISPTEGLNSEVYLSALEYLEIQKKSSSSPGHRRIHFRFD